MDPGKALRFWLLTGVVMVFIQIILGGITRLTGSGLSITKWEVVTGTLPPLTQAAWEETFDLYKQTPQYQKINRGMSMKEFRFIYFWEYLHRFWARLMGLVFIVPFLIFLWKRWLDSELLRRLILIIVLAAVVAGFGWIMVASGLIDRPWVNAYKLTLHLNLGILLYALLYWTYLRQRRQVPIPKLPLRGLLVGIIVLFGLQLLIGGLMSGMKACIYFPTWPGMHGQVVPDVLMQAEEWKWIHLFDYDSNAFTPALVQFFHRMNAYIIFIISVLYTLLIWRRSGVAMHKMATLLFVSSLLVQVILGILTVMQCLGRIPVLLGVLHQAGAILTLTVIMYLLYLSRGRPEQGEFEMRNR